MIIQCSHTCQGKTISLITLWFYHSAISVELYYIFATIWGREMYTLYGILFVVFGILLSVTACISVALTYFQLSNEDYRWWWRSIFSAGWVFCLSPPPFFHQEVVQASLWNLEDSVDLFKKEFIIWAKTTLSQKVPLLIWTLPLFDQSIFSTWCLNNLCTKHSQPWVLFEALHGVEK